MSWTKFLLMKAITIVKENDYAKHVFGRFSPSAIADGYGIAGCL